MHTLYVIILMSRNAISEAKNINTAEVFIFFDMKNIVICFIMMVYCNCYNDVRIIPRVYKQHTLLLKTLNAREMRHQ